VENSKYTNTRMHMSDHTRAVTHESNVNVTVRWSNLDDEVNIFDGDYVRFARSQY